MTTSIPSINNNYQLPAAQQSQPVQSIPQGQFASNNHIYDTMGMGQTSETFNFQEQPEDDTEFYTSSNFDKSDDKEEESWWGGLWDNVWRWVGSDQGTAVLGGALKMAGGLWLADQKAGIARGMPSGGGGNEGPSAAELQDARYAKHNESINTPKVIGLRKFKK